MLVSYRLIPIHRRTWDDMPPSQSVRGVVSASVSKQAGSGSNLLDSATLSVSSDISYEFPEGWYRLEAVYSGDGFPLKFPQHPRALSLRCLSPMQSILR